MIKTQEQLKKAANSMNSNNSASNLLIEKEKQAILERERYMQKMKDQMIIMYHGLFIEAKK